MKLRQFKPLYWIFNLFHYKQLIHNKKAYRKYNLKKSLAGSVSSKDFPDRESRAWLDIHDAKHVAPAAAGFERFPPDVQKGILQWSDNGYLILKGLFSEDECEAVNEEINTLLAKKKITFTNGNKLMFANKKSRLIDNVTRDAGLVSILEFLLGKKVVPFQTINFLKGSEQRAHSDSIHMTTYPLGYLIAAWVALEDITSDNGPLFYYPGSHKMPYLLNNDFNEGETAFTLGKKEYRDYEDVMEKIIKEKQLPASALRAKKGDVFIWHANLIHGGAPIINNKLTRKSMVIHYYADDVIKYHEITERPSLM